MDIQFACDANKETLNQKKHQVSFEEAQTVFLDDNAQLIYDPEHSEDEDRFVLLGISMRLRMLVVCHCYRENDKIIRIISARKATRKEEKQYYAKRI
jgi:hypothetical protein